MAAWATLATLALALVFAPASSSASRLAEQGQGSPCYLLDANGDLDLKRPQVWLRRYPSFRQFTL